MTAAAPPPPPPPGAPGAAPTPGPTAAAAGTALAEPPAIHLRGVTKRFGPTQAVAGIDLDVPAGSLVGLIGPNGAGKTTTMKSIAGLLAPDTGVVQVFGNDPIRQPGIVRRLVGWMPDFFGVYGGLSVHEYLDFFAAAYKVPKGERAQRVDDLLELVRLTDKRHTDVEGLSRGMQQRLGLARALVHDPEVLLLDEPASGLDPRARIELREILRALHGDGKTVLISSHILTELAQMCDSVVIMDSGGVVASGRTADLEASLFGGHTGVRIRLPDPSGTDAAVEAARSLGAAVEHVQPGVVYLRVAGADAEVAALVRSLIGAGVDVAELTQKRQDLEELFMSLTTRAAPAGAPPQPPPPEHPPPAHTSAAQPPTEGSQA